MKNAATLFLLGMLLAGLTPGCSKMQRLQKAGEPAAAGAGLAVQRPESDRMLIWQASIKMEVSDVAEAADRAAKLAAEHGGFVESKSIRDEKTAQVALRVPSQKLSGVMDSLKGLGTETYRHVSSEDVTEQYMDTEARLKNAVMLRDKLQALIKRARDVKDILEIEKELSRVQADIDSMEGRLKRLKGQVDFARLDVTLVQKKILGPLGYVVQGLAWLVKKLFVIR